VFATILVTQQKQSQVN